ncbi:ANTAR domain-containing protein [Amycolatopsis sp. FU40]|uniref:ANTAR domain-containing protein n=1 Tax=Amycolatopsis sp. FU40 TaxID=2914159 RepID=UPI001F39FC6C|nr:ANTAR domain-containing protein [Amycolatopsis sp. FU40]UKD57393.1 ANTAR domain-containing protein [Amycolatopsis sp. FU40]
MTAPRRMPKTSEPEAPALEPELLRAFVDLADTLADDYTPAGLFQRLTGYCVTLLGATAAGVLLVGSQGEPEIRYASGDTDALLGSRRTGVPGFGQTIPLGLRGEALGTLVLLSPEPLSGDQLDAARALADIASVGMLQERAIRHGATRTGQLQRALDSRIVIEQAKGVLACAGGIPVDAAFERLRAYCRRNNLRIGAVADAVARALLPPAQILRDFAR